MVLLYLSQEGKMLNNQMSAFCFPCTALPTDYDTLKHRDTSLVTKASGRGVFIINYMGIQVDVW